MSVTKRKNLKKKMIGCLCFAIIASGMAAAPDVPCLSGIGAVSVSAEEADPAYVSEVSLGQIVYYANSPESCPTGVTAQYVNSNNTIELTLTNSGTYKFSGSNLIDSAYVDVKIIVPSGVTAAIEFAEGSTINNDYGGYAFSNESKYSGMNIDGECYKYDYAVPFKVEGKLTVSGDLSVDTYSYYGECTYYDKDDSFFYHTKHGNSAPLYEGEGTFTADYFTVKYVDDDGLTVDEQYFIGGERNVIPTQLAIDNLICPFADGKDFKIGGILSENTTVTNHLDTDLNGECDICKTKINYYTVTFNTNGGSSLNAILVKPGETIHAPTAPTKEGYTFGGWYTDEACTTPYDFSSAVEDNVTLYPKWVVEFSMNEVLDGYFNDRENYIPPTGVEINYNSNCLYIILNSGSYIISGSNYVDGAYVDVSIRTKNLSDVDIKFDDAAVINTSFYNSTGSEGKVGYNPFWVGVFSTLNVSGKLSVDSFASEKESGPYITKLYYSNGTFNIDSFTVKYVDEDGNVIDENYYLSGETYNVKPSSYLGTDEEFHNIAEEFPCMNVPETASENTTVTARKTHIDENSDHECDYCGVSAKLTGIEIGTAPTKTSYYTGQELDVTGGTIKVSYEFGDDKTVDITADMISGFDNTKEGKQTLTVTYGGKTVTFDVTVAAAKVTGIKVSTMPKTSYFIGEKLDVTDGKITVTYEDGKTETVDLTAAMVSGFDSSKAGKQTLTVTYDGKTTTFSVTVAAAKVTGIEMTALPTKTSYFVGDKLDVTGGKIKATYEDGKTETVDLTAAMVSGFDSTKAGKNTLTVTYGGKTATFSVTVAENVKPAAPTVQA